MKSEDKIEILIVDDDTELCHLLCTYLDKQGFTTIAAEDGKVMDELLGKSTADLIILDLMLPGEDGLSIVKRLNSQLQIPIIILSASGEDVDRIIGLEMGADDYLAKPFNPRELLARIRSVLRRRNLHKNNYVDQHDLFYKFGPYTFDIHNQILQCSGEPVLLTSGETSLLKILVENPKRVLTRDVLLEKLKGYDCAPYDRSIDVRIMRLRQKIETDTLTPQYIQTVWGKGYRFVPDHFPSSS